jgi:hypothetical protein
MLSYIRRITPGLVAVVLATGCATQGSNPSTADGQAPRVLAVMDVPLAPAAGGASDGTGARTFGSGPIQGRVDASGAWSLRGEITHRRLRCATYELGLITGRGDASCTRVDWVTEADFATRLTHCNAATRIHSGGGTLGLAGPAIASINCVRVVTRCTGAC